MPGQPPPGPRVRGLRFRVPFLFGGLLIKIEYKEKGYTYYQVVTGEPGNPVRVMGLGLRFMV